MGWVSAAGVMAAVLIISGRVASAETGSSDHAQQQFLLFSGADLWRNGGFAHGGVLWSPDGVDRDGFTLKVMFNGGEYRYRSGALAADVTGLAGAVAVLPGWRFSSGKLIVTAFGGLDLQYHRLLPDDPSAGLRGGYAGLRVGFDLWYEPSNTTMVAVDASASTIGPSYGGRAAYGWRVFDRFYLGPEVGGFTSNGNYSQVRGGIHITGFKTEQVEWSGAVGWSSDSDRRGSLYGRMGMVMRR